MSCFSKVLRASAEYKTISNAIREHRLPAGVTGVSPIHKAHLVHSLCEDEGCRAVLIVADEAEGSRLVENLNAMKGGALLYPARDWSLRPSQGQSRDYEQQRLGVLGHMLEGEYRVVVCSVEAAVQLTLPPEELYTRTVTLNTRLGCRGAACRRLRPCRNGRRHWAVCPTRRNYRFFPPRWLVSPAVGILGRHD